MADSKRRGERAVDENRDDRVLDAVDDESPDQVDDIDDEDDVDDDGFDGEDVAPARSGARTAGARKDAVARGDGVAVRRAKSSVNGKRVKADRVVSIEAESPGLGARIARFIREVVAELRKVNWPNRKELLTYASVVIVFVVIMMTIVGLLDYGFAWVVGHVFAG